MPRFYLPEPMTLGDVISLPINLVHHCNVLRLQLGAPLTLFNGLGGSYTATLNTLEKKHGTALISAFDAHEIELPYAVTIAQALPESGKMDWIIEKSVELGASAIKPMAAQRSVTRLSGERAEKRGQHWQGIIVAASEQCGRNRLATLHPVCDFKNVFAPTNLPFKDVSTHAPSLLFLSPTATQSLSTWAQLKPPHDVTLLIGPEGGFSEQEQALAIHQGAVAVSLGNRVLRTETAALAALSVLNGFWGGFE